MLVMDYLIRKVLDKALRDFVVKGTRTMTKGHCDSIANREGRN